MEVCFSIIRKFCHTKYAIDITQTENNNILRLCLILLLQLTTTFR